MTSKCHVCKTEEAKYTCPRCFTKSCSLKCCKAHKKEDKCNGKRNQIGFVDIKRFDESVLKSDYHFLNNIVRESDAANRDLRSTKRRKIRGRVSEFKKKCEERGVDIRIMPEAMEKRQINTSYYDRKRDRIMWHIDWIFKSALDGELRICSKCVDENSTLKEVIEMHISSRKKWPGKASVQYRLKQYTSVAYMVLMRKQMYNRNGKPVYIKIEPSARFCDVLKGKKVVEFPEFLVILVTDKPSSYQLDEEQDAELQNTEQDADDVEEVAKVDGEVEDPAEEEDRHTTS